MRPSPHLARRPHPYSAQDRRAGYRYDLSILQAEFALTQIWDRALHGRYFFEEVIRENIDLGLPELGVKQFTRIEPKLSDSLRQAFIFEPKSNLYKRDFLNE